MYHKRLNWLWFFAQGEKDPVYSIQSGSKVAHYIQVVHKPFLMWRVDHFLTQRANY
jgi:hypothetical protein